MIVGKWTGRSHDGWIGGNGIYEFSLAHGQRALQLVSTALQMLLYYLFFTTFLGGWEIALFPFEDEEISEELANVSCQADAEFDQFFLRLLGDPRVPSINSRLVIRILWWQ